MLNGRLIAVLVALLASCSTSPVSSLDARPLETRPVYAGPHVRDYDVIGEIGPADRLPLIGRSGDTWVAFEYGENLGWIQRFFLDIDGNPNRLRTVAPREVRFVEVPDRSAPPAEPGSKGVSWQNVGSHLGEFTTVCGPVVSTTYASSSNGQPTFLNIGEDYPSSRRFTVVIWGEDRGNFSSPPEDLYWRQEICVTGEVEVYRGIYEIEVSSPVAIDTD